MNKRKFLPLVLLAVATGVFWVLDRNADQAPTRGLGPDTELTGNALSPGPPSDLQFEGVSESATRLAGQTSSDIRQSARARGPAVAVRIVLPKNSPFDASLRVLALPGKKVRSSGGRKYLDTLARGEELGFAWCSAPVAADGSATLLLAPDIEKPSLIVDGEFLYLKKAVALVDLKPVELRPQLGASLALTLTTPDGLAPLGEVRLMGANLSGQSMGFSSRTSPVSQHIFRGLAPDLNWMVLPQLEQHFTHGKLGVKLTAGERRDIHLDLMLGCLIEGQVVDDAGQPMPKITVSLVNKQPWARMLDAVEAKTDESGRYSLGRVGPGTQNVVAKKEGRVTAESGELELVDGETLGGVRLVLGLGASISGTVYAPDGSPARKVLVTASHRTERARFGPSRRKRNQQAGKSVSDKHGHFAITGLGSEKYSIQAKKSGRGSLGGKANLRASQAAVQAGVSDLRLDLLAPHILKGSVVDDQGQPVTAFRVRGKSVESGGPEESQTFEDPEGRFQFEKLGAGRWTITIRAEGFHQEETHSVSLPRDGEPLLIVLHRQGSIAGQVLSPSGSPVPGALVRADNGEGSRTWGPRRGPRSEADEEGRFLIEDLAPGAYHVLASGKTWADSEKTIVEISAGLQEKGVVLQLRTGGSISGLVLEEDGNPMSGRRVHWGENAMGFGNRGETKTDSAGRFRFQNVTPGKWQVSAAPSFEEMGDRMQGRGGAEVMGELMDGLLTQTVQVFERENTHVQLGGEPKAPIQVTGRVLYQGQPVENAEVYAVTEGKAIIQGMKSAKSATDGTFELTLDRPDAYVFSAQAKGLGVEVLVDVPDTVNWSIDLTIPSGGIAGTVLSPEGQPAPGIRLSLQRNDGLGRIRWQGSQTSSDVAGQYSFDGLQPGLYTVRANSASFGGGNKSLGSELREGLRVTTDGQQRADFRLQTPGLIKGSVRGPDGLPHPGVSIFFRDASGNLIKNLSRTQTDVAGRFQREGLSPGHYTVSARSSNLACEDSKPVQVRESKSTLVQLTLDHATVLWVSLLDDKGVPQRLRAEVVDDDERHVESGMTPEVMRSAFRQGTSSSKQRIGPLPPGTYLVLAYTADGRSAQQEVRITGRDKEQSIVLRIK